MRPGWLWVVLAAVAARLVVADGRAETPAAPLDRAVVIPIKGEIAPPLLYVLRRGLKEAAQERAAVILDMDTLGGRIDVALDMMKALETFDGTTITYVDEQAMSAGAIISSSTQQIWFAPRGVMGAAAPVGSSGEDIPETMKEKVISYVTARVRAATENQGHRAAVVTAMIDHDYELKIGDQVIKAKDGPLLSLTAEEAFKSYGKPPRPLLAAGIAASIQQVADQALGGKPILLQRLAPTGAETAAEWLNDAAPVLLGLGLFSLFVAFKLSHFGVFGIAGIVLLGLVFFGSSIAGLSGHEPLVLFCVGVVLVALELIFWHSAGFLGAIGVGLMVASLVWAMADLWPGEPLPMAWDAHAFARPLLNAAIGVSLATVLSVIALRYLPSGWILDRLAVRSVAGGRAQESSASPEQAARLDGLIGQQGIAATPLRPGGFVQVGGERFEAAVPIGAIDAGAKVVVRGRKDFSLLVEPISHDG